MPLSNHEAYKLRLLQEKKANEEKVRREAIREPVFQSFVNITNGNNKFWKISNLIYDGSGIQCYVVKTQYGAIGTDGVEIEKRFYYSWQATDYINKKVSEKLGKGYERL